MDHIFLKTYKILEYIKLYSRLYWYNWQIQRWNKLVYRISFLVLNNTKLEYVSKKN